jgi:uroporphyrinogen-III decarboxylase
VLCGNLDPVAVIMAGSKELIKEKYDAVKISIPSENWILMGGCEIPMSTPTENMIFLREISK